MHCFNFYCDLTFDVFQFCSVIISVSCKVKVFYLAVHGGDYLRVSQRFACAVLSSVSASGYQYYIPEGGSSSDWAGLFPAKIYSEQSTSPVHANARLREATYGTSSSPCLVPRLAYSYSRLCRKLRPNPSRRSRDMCDVPFFYLDAF